MSTHNSLIFTICSANYLAQAITLGNSVKNTNPDILFRIYLVDRLEGREEVKDMIPFSIIEIEKVPIEDFEGMILRYNIVELNTAVKPYIFHHVLSEETHINKIVYLDPDIMVFNSFNDILSKLDTYNFIITPHILTPCDGNPYVQPEKNFLATGIFNLGFISIKRSEESNRMITWWKQKLINQGYARLNEHLFYDQKWIDFLPVLFNSVYIEKKRGYNMAPWNLHERILSKNEGIYLVNKNEPLIFFHFSSYSVSSPNNIAHTTKFTLDNRTDLKELFELYHTQLLKNNEYYFKKMVYFFDSYKIEIMRNNALNNSSSLMKKMRKLKYQIEAIGNIKI